MFLGFAWLLDPINAWNGDESLVGDFNRGRCGHLVNLVVAGVICAVLWEFWNYWAGAKWIYTVPVFPEWRLFEMPLLGYGGFPACSVECFTMYVALRRLVWRAAARPISI